MSVLSPYFLWVVLKNTVIYMVMGAYVLLRNCAYQNYVIHGSPKDSDPIVDSLVVKLSTYEETVFFQVYARIFLFVILVVDLPFLWWIYHSCGGSTNLVVDLPFLWWICHSCGGSAILQMQMSSWERSGVGLFNYESPKYVF